MDRDRPVSGLRAAALAMALFAITLNFLQPLAHAALLREGAPSVLWTAFCNSMAADPASQKSDGTVPADAQDHGCCLGLAHASALLTPTAAFIVLPPVATARAALRSTGQSTPTGIRDGPFSPRGPPSFV
jgi:hypothetical protein